MFPNSAWAVFDETIYDDSGELYGQGFGTRFLEKVEGEWKINYVSTFDTKSYEDFGEKEETEAETED